MPEPSPADSISIQPPRARRRARKRRWPRILFWFACCLLVLLFFAAVRGRAVAALRGQPRCPMLDGDLHLAGLSAPVTVRRDAHGVPHIDAATQDDLFVAQGYVTAQDRLWQMDAFAAMPTATWQRSWARAPGARQDTARSADPQPAQRIYNNLPADDRARLDDYARGVNLYIAQCENPDTLPAGVPPAHVSPAVLERRRLRQRGSDDGADAGHALPRPSSRARAFRAQLAQSLARSRSLSGRLVARPSAHRHQGGPDPAATRAAPRNDDDDDDDEDAPSTASAQRAARIPAAGPARAASSCSACPTCDGCAQARTTGSSPASTPPAASRCSQTICIWL